MVKDLCMKKMFVVGNGFDLHHNLKTTYKHFYDHLKKNKYLFAKTCALFWDQIDRDDWLWSDFEVEISAFNYEVFVPDYIRYNER